tara:strand:+ start:348 stop:1004 length:657 start_codon:yes stop_codon:yes gene_type:complete
MSSINVAKKQAAIEAIKYIKDCSVIGVGTGSTVNYFIKELGKIRSRFDYAVSSSEATTELLKLEGVAVTELNNCGDPDIYVDGADEATLHRQLIKGGGGALTREKIIASSSKIFICIIDESKLVKKLGSFPVAVEVIPMARSYVARKLVQLGGAPEWRQGFVTDNGNWILDVYNLDLADSKKVELQLDSIAGVVTNGIFSQRPADKIIIGGENNIKEI